MNNISVFVSVQNHSVFLYKLLCYLAGVWSPSLKGSVLVVVLVSLCKLSEMTNLTPILRASVWMYHAISRQLPCRLLIRWRIRTAWPLAFISGIEEENRVIRSGAIVKHEKIWSRSRGGPPLERNTTTRTEPFKVGSLRTLYKVNLILWKCSKTTIFDPKFRNCIIQYFDNHLINE